MTDHTLLDDLSSFAIARLQSKVNNTSLSPKDRRDAKESIAWIKTVGYEVRGSRRALPLGVAIIARYAQRWPNHKDYDPLWNTIDMTGG